MRLNFLLILIFSILLGSTVAFGQSGFGLTVGISVTPGDTVCHGVPVHFTATASDTSVPYGYIWMRNHTHVGPNSRFYNTITLNNGDTVWCVMTNVAGDTVLDTSGYIIMTILPLAPIASISGLDSVCIGSSITLHDSVSGGHWHSNNTAVFTIDSVTGIITTVGPGNTRAVYFTSNICGLDSARMRIRVQAPGGPIMGNNVICMDSIFLVRDTARGGLWQVSDSTIAILIAPFGVFQAITTGTTTISYTGANACGAYAESMDISIVNCDSAASVTTVPATPMGTSIYPDPSNGRFTIYNGEKLPSTISVADVFGNKLYQMVLEAGARKDLSLDLPSGIYMISSYSGSETKITKLQIIR